MQLTQEKTGDANRIRSYGAGSVTINETVHRRTTIVTRDRVIVEWPPGDSTALVAEHMDTLLELEPEIILIGTGSTQRFPAHAVLARVIRAGVGIEVMNTPAACRTYNVLTAEGRRVAAALFMIEEAEEGAE